MTINEKVKMWIDSIRNNEVTLEDFLKYPEVEQEVKVIVEKYFNNM